MTNTTDKEMREALAAEGKAIAADHQLRSRDPEKRRPIDRLIEILDALASAAHGEPVAWLDEAGERVITAKQKYSALTDGGACASSVRPYSIPAFARPTAPAEPANPVTEACRRPLTDEQIEAGRRATFSTDNPFCPCDSKTMSKAVRWAERALQANDTTKGKA